MVSAKGRTSPPARNALVLSAEGRISPLAEKLEFQKGNREFCAAGRTRPSARNLTLSVLQKEIKC